MSSPTFTRLAEVAARPAGRVLGAVMGVLARLRRRRPLHPRGVLLSGTLVASGDRARSVLPGPRTHVLVRLSVSVGLPRAWPDVWGLAVRWTDDGAPQDVLFASTGHGPATRYVLAPRRTLMGGWLTTLMPLRAPWGPVLLALRPLDQPPPGSAPRTGVVLEVLHASPLGPWRPFGTLELHGPVSDDATRDGPDPGVRFDPTRHAPRHLGTYRWEDLLRTPAYAVAQRTARVEER